MTPPPQTPTPERQRLYCLCFYTGNSGADNNHQVAQPFGTEVTVVCGRGSADPRYPARPRLCPLSHPFSRPLLSRQAPNKERSQTMLALSAEWLCRSSTNRPSLFDRNTTRTCSAGRGRIGGGDPPCKEVMNAAWTLN